MKKNQSNPAHEKKSGKTKFQIESLLPVGKENAVTTAELVKRTRSAKRVLKMPEGQQNMSGGQEDVR